jgi:site-specific recombinase XerD
MARVTIVLDPAKFDLKTCRSSFCTRLLRFGFEVRTVQRLPEIYVDLPCTQYQTVPASRISRHTVRGACV